MKYFLCILLVGICNVIANEYFSEELNIKPLTKDLVQTHFQFTMRRSVDDNDENAFSNFQYFPKNFAQLVLPTGISELSLSLTQSHWRWEEWGHPTSEIFPSGAQVIGWFDEKKNEDKGFNAFKRVCNKLSGLLCGSFNFIDKQNTAEPCLFSNPSTNTNGLEFDPSTCIRTSQMKMENDYNKTDLANQILNFVEPYVPLNLKSTKQEPNRKRVFYSKLPRENVCTENLTPFLKLLPCRSVQGLGKLLNGLQMFSAAYSALSLRLHPFCEKEGKCNKNDVELVVSATMVIGAKNAKNFVDSDDLLFSFNSLFEGAAEKLESCSAATNSFIYLDLPKGEKEEMFNINIQPDKKIGNTFVYALKKPTKQRQQPAKSTNTGEKVAENKKPPLPTTTPFIFKDIVVKSDQMSNVIKNLSMKNNPVRFTRHITGTGQERRGILSFIRNNLNENLYVTYFETIPWTMHVMLGSLEIKSGKIDNEIIKNDNIVQYMNYVPSLDRKRPMTLELIMILPPKSVVSVSFEFQISFLRFMEHPPDANRGFDIGSAALVLSSFNGGFRWSPLLYSEKDRVHDDNLIYYSRNIIVPAPTPDFSMPYNVMTVTSTVLALCFGFVFGNVVKYWQKEELPKETPNLLIRIKNQLFKR